MSKFVERLTVTNFLGIKHADIEIKSFNVLIGPQASGKSVIAKLLAFFGRIEIIIRSGLSLNKSTEYWKARVIEYFVEVFPHYGWKNAQFRICYWVDGIELSVEHNSINNSNQPDFNISKEFEEAVSKCQVGLIVTESLYQAFQDSLSLLYTKYPRLMAGNIFIPASRSFYATVQQNIFALMSSNTMIDPMLSQFGQFYESMKKRFVAHQNDRMNDLIEQILKGKYQYQDEQDWIIAGERKVNLAQASSGQQEALPMLMTLASVGAVESQNDLQTIFIEEPEAHLFPIAQSQILSLLSIVNNSGKRVFITTHSPYMLSALNNLIMANDKIAQGTITQAELENINGPCDPIAFDDVSAYTIVDGVTQTIKDDEYRMVGGDILDSVSDHFESVVNRLFDE